MDYSGYGTVVSEKAAREHLRQSARLRGSLPPDLVIRMVAAFDPGFTADSPASITYSKRYLRLGLFLTLLPPTPAGNFEIARFLLSLVLGFNDSGLRGSARSSSSTARRKRIPPSPSRRPGRSL